MDFGPRWPWWLLSGVMLAGAALLVWMAWRQAGAFRSWRVGFVRLVLWWALAIAMLGWDTDLLCGAGRWTGVELPDCDWEHHPAPTAARDVFWFVLAGGVIHAFRIGIPLAALAYGIRYAIVRLRRLRAPAPS